MFMFVGDLSSIQMYDFSCFELAYNGTESIPQ